MNLVAVLKTSPIFSTLSPGHIESLAASAVEREYAPGACVFAQGDDAASLLLFVSGDVALQVPAAGRTPPAMVTVDMVAAGQVFGWAALVEPYTYLTSAVCLRQSILLQIDRVALLSMMRDKVAAYAIYLGCAQALAAKLNETRTVLASERFAVSPSGSPGK